jgi:hypothetical protein
MDVDDMFNELDYTNDLDRLVVEHGEYKVVVEAFGEQWDVKQVRWDHREKRMVLELDD